MDDRLIRSWARLAPPGPSLAARQGALRNVCRTLLQKRSAEEVGLVFMIVQDHLDEDTQSPLVRRAVVAQAHRDLAARTELVERLKSAITEVCRFHSAAASHKWYSMRVSDGRIQGPATRPWSRYPRFYRRVLRVLEADPALRFARSADAPRGRAGNPIKRRNGALAAELRGLGVSRAQVSTILRAIAFRSLD